MTRLLASGLLTLGLLFLAAGWTLAGFWPVGLSVVILMPLSLYLVKRKFQPALSLALTLVVLTAAMGLWRGLDQSLALAAVLCTLAAWDLEGFSRRLAQVPAEDGPQRIEQRHLLWVSLVFLLGAGLSLLVRFIRFEANFERAALLALLAFGGLGALLSWLRNQEA